MTPLGDLRGVWALGVCVAVVTPTACHSKSPSPSDVVATVVVTPASVTLDPGGTGKFTAEARRADGSIVSGSPISWASSASAVASVSTDGTVTAHAGGTATVTATASGVGGSASVTVRDVYDLDGRGVPSIVTSDYIESAKIAQVSLFRSGIGHDYSDSLEQCRSMKHYFMPRGNVDWSTVAIFAAAAGTITGIQPETTFGSQVHLKTAAVTAATIVIFHVVPDAGIAVGVSVTAGQRLGHHIGAQTMSDVAIRIETPGGQRLVSYFEAMTESVFAAYRTRGAGARSDFVIPRSSRDASPLVCSGEQFQNGGSLTNWFIFQ